MIPLSVCVVTKNEAHNIEACLQSVRWADEIVVIDSESTDETVELARKYTENILITPYQGCGPQKKLAVEHARNDWVLILDADERITPELAAELQETLRDPLYDAYQIPYISFFCGREIRFGDWLNEKHIRLINKNKCSIVPRLIHFRINVNGKIGTLKYKIKHFSFPNLDVVLNKMNNYSTDGAKHYLSVNKSTNLFSAIAHGVFAFVRSYFLKLGFLDGRAGFMLAFAIAEGSYYKYLKLLEMRK